MNNRRRIFAASVVLSLMGSLGSAVAAGSKSVVYYSTYPGYSLTYLIDWQGTTQARVVNNVGSADGTVVRNGNQRVITLKTPITQQVFGDYDPCIDDSVLLQQDTLQVAVNTLSGFVSRGTSAVIELGTLTTLNGCNPGQVQPFGSLSDPGFQTNNLSLALRPSVADLVPGVALAGLSEQQRAPFDQVTSDVATFQPGGQLSFAASGHVLSAAFDADQWLQLPLAWGTRAYTRIAVDRRTGGERWLEADWEGGRPARVQMDLMVKPAAGAGFGTVRQASRKWQSGLGSIDTSIFRIDLFQDGTGDRVLIDLTTGTESHTPLKSWAFDGASIVQKRGTSVERIRTWVPLANAGRTRFVFESEVAKFPDGTVQTFILPRVNVYTDTGAATPPPPPLKR